MNDQLVVIDTETGGLDPSKDSILSIALVVWSLNNPVVKYKEWFVLEDHLVISKQLVKATRVDVDHIVDLKKLKEKGMSPRGVCDEIFHFLHTESNQGSKHTIAGHNIGSFDLGFIKRLFRLGGYSNYFPFSYRVVDTHSISKYLKLAGYEMPEKITSDSLLDFFDIQVKPENRHTALGDAMATAKLLSKLIKYGKQS